MADETGNEPLANGEDTAPAVGLISQYVKDLSFENPNAPAVFQWQGQPQIDVQFNIGANQIADDVHEVVLKIEDVHKSFGTKHVHRGISLEHERNRFWGIG